MKKKGKALSLLLLGLLILAYLPPRLAVQSREARPDDAQQDGENRAAVVVRFDDDSVATACVSFDEPEISGFDLLTRAGLDLEIEAQGLGTLVCSIDGTGCPASDCLCQCRGGDDCVYWSYWHRLEDEWIYAAIGASAYPISDGAVDGWSWGPGSVTEAIAPPELAFDDICQAPEDTPTPTPTQTPTETPTPSATPTVTLTPSITPTREGIRVTPPPAPSPAPTDTPPPMPTVTRTAVPTATVRPTATPTPTRSTVLQTAAAPRVTNTPGASPTPFPTQNPFELGTRRPAGGVGPPANGGRPPGVGTLPTPEGAVGLPRPTRTAAPTPTSVATTAASTVEPPTTAVAAVTPQPSATPTGTAPQATATEPAAVAVVGRDAAPPTLPPATVAPALPTAEEAQRDFTYAVFAGIVVVLVALLWFAGRRRRV